MNEMKWNFVRDVVNRMCEMKMLNWESLKSYGSEPQTIHTCLSMILHDDPSSAWKSQSQVAPIMTKEDHRGK